MKIGHKLYVGTFTDLEYFNCAQWCNQNNAYMKDCRDKGFWEICEVEMPSLQEQNNMKIAELKAKLSATDYVVIKIAEGEATKEEYADVLANRKAWREEIRELEND